MASALPLLVGICLLSACGTTPVLDDAGGDTGLVDAGLVDAALADSGPADSGPADSGPDAGPPPGPDSGPADAAVGDAGPATFLRFRLELNRNLCASGDCYRFFEWNTDGSMEADVDYFNTMETRTAAASSADVDQANAIFGDPALLALIAGTLAPCDGPTEFREKMLAVTTHGNTEQVTSFCDDAVLVDARAEVDRLLAAYFP